MINNLISFSVKNRFIVILIYSILISLSFYYLKKIPIDAIPDLSDNQVIVYTKWEGKSPKVINEQITYPLSSNFQGLSGIKSIRAFSEFGYSVIYLIFKDDIDIYFARNRVIEKLTYIKDKLPENVNPIIGPDATGVGHILWYVLESKNYDLQELRTLQDWYIKYQLNSVDGVSEVASIGGFVKEYQINIIPDKLRIYDISIKELQEAIKSSNNYFSGSNIEINSAEYIIRSSSYLKSLKDIENIVIKYINEVPIYLKNIAKVQVGPEQRRGILEENGKGEVVGGIIVMRYNENTNEVINRVKEKINEISKSLPKGVKIKIVYDRSELIKEAINTLKSALTEEILLVSFIIFLFFLHIRSTFIISISLPLTVLIGMILIYYFKINLNIMSLGGIALAIGDLADSTIVMTENSFRQLEKNNKFDKLLIIKSCQQLAAPILFSMLIIVISFLPLIMLEGQEGKLFKPLVYTKTIILIVSIITSFTIIPVLISLFLKGKIKSEEKNLFTKFFINLYYPIIGLALKFRKIFIFIAFLLIISIIPLSRNIGYEFMPPLDEGSILFMPTMLPNVSINQAKKILQIQDKIISEYPEVKYVLGKLGRADTSTDPASISMFETIIILKPKNEWRKGITKNDIINDLNNRLQIPGVSNGWTQPIINRINMLSTGIRTDFGIKVYGEDVNILEKIAYEIEKNLRKIKGITDIYTERFSIGKYIDISIDREKIVKYGVNLSEVELTIETLIGGKKISEFINNRERYPIRIRYLKDFRDDKSDIENVYVKSAIYGYIPLKLVSNISFQEELNMISSENGFNKLTVYFNIRSSNYGKFIDEAKSILDKNLKLPESYFIEWSGQYENYQRALKKLKIIIPIILLITFIFLYLTFYSVKYALIILISIPFALIGSFIYMYIENISFSIAVIVGFIALIGISTQTGVVMITYLKDSLDKYLENNSKLTEELLKKSIIEGAILRLRPKLMTSLINFIGILPMIYKTSTGSEFMKPIAAPLFGGILSSTFLVLIIIPILFFETNKSLVKK
jgi:Cu(I)/Ag(I) efflux system membrane protein CusA/SilA